MSAAKTLTVAQLLILTTAAQRPDHMVLPLPPTIRARGGAQRNLLGALLKMELVAEVPVDDASIAWRTDEAGQHHGLRITADGLMAGGDPASAREARTPSPRMKPGSTLLREWHGRTYTVLALDEGFEMAAQRFASLSEVARHITGAHWSGPRFFGIRRASGTAGANPGRRHAGNAGDA